MKLALKYFLGTVGNNNIETEKRKKSQEEEVATGNGPAPHTTWLAPAAYLNCKLEMAT